MNFSLPILTKGAPDTTIQLDNSIYPVFVIWTDILIATKWVEEFRKKEENEKQEKAREEKDYELPHQNMLPFMQCLGRKDAQKPPGISLCQRVQLFCDTNIESPCGIYTIIY